MVECWRICWRRMDKSERLLHCPPPLPGEMPAAPEVIIVTPSSDSVASSSASLPRGVDDLNESGAPPPFEINVQRATPTNSLDDESCLEEETELQISITTTKQNKNRPLSVASTASNSLLGLPNNMRNIIKSFADRARGKPVGRSMDLSITPATSVSDLRHIDTGKLKRRLDSFARRPESEAESEVDDEKTKNLSRLCSRWPHFRSHVTKLINRFKTFRCTCDYYIDPYGKCCCASTY